MTQEDILTLVDAAAVDRTLRDELVTAQTSESVESIARAFGLKVHDSSGPDILSDAELEGLASSATDHTCAGTTDCCYTKRTCFGTTDCCR